MIFTFDTALHAFITLFVTIDPLGLAPLFLVVTAGMTRRQRYAVALRATVISYIILILFCVAGAIILDTLGITIHAFRVAGGLLLFFTAFEMVFEKRQERKEKTSERAITKDLIANVAVFPLSIPLIAGPGAISASILLSAQMGNSWEGNLLLIGVITLVILLVLVSFMAAEFIDKYLGTTGRMVLTRLLGVLLAALSVQFVFDGITALLAA